MAIKINEAVRTDIRNSVLCWLATVDKLGVPNVTPKELFTSYGDNLIVIANIASPKSVQNVRTQSNVCVSFVDVFRQRGFKVTGQARIVEPEHPDFFELVGDLAHRAGTAFSINNIIAVKVEQIARIWAPSYKLFPDRSENERMQSAYATYGVRPAHEGHSDGERESAGRSCRDGQRPACS